MSNLKRLQAWLQASSCRGVVVPSTDEYLSEFAQPHARRLEWATGFHGSMGLSVVLQNGAALFLDGRYKAQGHRETAGLAVEIVDMSESVKRQWLKDNFHVGERLGVDTRLQSYVDVEHLRDLTSSLGISVLELERHPIDEIWALDRPASPDRVIVDYPTYYSGLRSEEKCVQVQEWLKGTQTDWHLVADPEDVAWLLNVRTAGARMDSDSYANHVVPIPLSRVLIHSDGSILWFVESARLDRELRTRVEPALTIMDPAEFESSLREHTRRSTVSANLRRTPHKYAAIARDVGAIKDDAFLSRWRWKKHPNEIARAREGHRRDSLAVIRFLSWLQRAVTLQTVTEIDAARKLVAFRRESSSYEGLSMPMMSASGTNGALAHYVPTENSNRRLNDHPIYWIDSGGQYHGCSTDNTVCIAVGEPEARHIHAHSLVLKGFIALTQARFPIGTYSTQLDSIARQHLWQAGMDYAHGTGHGVGNFMNIHEGPYIRKEINHPLVAPMEAGMIVANEPAYYAEGDFGVRIECHLLTVESAHPGFLEFEILSRLPIDPRLVDMSLLTTSERRWLAEYHERILGDYAGQLDAHTTQWLQNLTEVYVRQAH